LTLVSRSFHYVTSYYNYYYNAYDGYKLSLRKVDETFKYNYSSTLPVILAGDSQISGMVSGDMDRSIKKCTELIRKHSITVKPERSKGVLTPKEKEFINRTEYVKWAREAWLLIGEARVWKGVLDEAAQTFEYVQLQNPNTPYAYEAQLWLARISIINGDFINAEDKLRTVEAIKNKPDTRRFKHLFTSTWAFFYAKQSRFAEAIPFIKRTIEKSNSKYERTRLTYLLAQLSVLTDNKEDGIRYYSKVLKMSPPYDMSFNAKIGLASITGNLENQKEMRKLLVKLSKDEKNKDYLDLIYYTLGNIEKAEGNIEKAIEYFKLSATKSTSNTYQKGLSYYTLAEYYFAKPDYKQSQAYYDSALTSLDNTFPDYQKLDVKTHNLTKLVDNLNLVTREDSLQKVAKMPKSDRDNLIAGIINKLREDEQKKLEEENAERQRAILYQQNQRTQPSEQQTGKWYFYNQTQLSFGQSEFQMRWGKRKLEDNWRRKNRRISTIEMATTNLQITASDTSKNPQKVISNKSAEFYLQDLPLNDSLLDLSNKRIEEAMFNVGEVYQNDLNDYSETILAFEKYVQRFPNSTNAVQAYYNLYQVRIFTNKNAEAEKYKKIIISRFPTSSFAVMLTNPNYLAELNEKKSEENSFYEGAYALYEQGNYNESLRKIDEGLAKFPNTKLEPQYNLLKAMCIGKTSDLRSFRNSLTELTQKYPKTDVSERAQNILEYIRRQELQLTADAVTNIPTVDTSNTAVKQAVEYNKPKGEHIVAILVPKKSNMNQLKFNIVSFNVDVFISLDLEVSNQPFNDFFELIKVTGFKDSQQAMEYFDAASHKEGLLNPLAPQDFSSFVISEENFVLFIEDKSLADYLKFFNSNY
ncbi:MAG TPA: hypothetical protein DIW31_02700, partial [Bacteroidales bacterium]|nr:hypothetical protein [Bacteroidales bacterium]